MNDLPSSQFVAQEAAARRKYVQAILDSVSGATHVTDPSTIHLTVDQPGRSQPGPQAVRVSLYIAGLLGRKDQDRVLAVIEKVNGEVIDDYMRPDSGAFFIWHLVINDPAITGFTLYS